jgi:hypothetical protein
MTKVIALQELLMALYDSMHAAREYASGHKMESGRLAASGAASRAKDVLNALGSAHILDVTSFEVIELTLRFDCELHQQHGRMGLRLRSRHFWRSPVSLPLEIRLYGSEPLRTDVRIGNQLLKTIAGRPQQKERVS